MGSAAAAAALAGLDETGMRYALSYAAQQVSGIWSWPRDAEHVEKSFDFSGMGARNGVTAASMVQAGFSGVSDVFEGEHNVLNALSPAPTPGEMVANLGSRFYVTETAIKPYPVGYPIQAALDAFFALRQAHGLTVDNVERMVVRLPTDGAGIVNDRAMPDVNCQHMVAMALGGRRGDLCGDPLLPAHGRPGGAGGEGAGRVGPRRGADGPPKLRAAPGCRLLCGTGARWNTTPPTPTAPSRTRWIPRR